MIRDYQHSHWRCKDIEEGSIPDDDADTDMGDDMEEGVRAGKAASLLVLRLTS